MLSILSTIPSINVSTINNSNINNIDINNVFACVIIIVNNASGNTISAVFAIIFAESLLVVYSSSTFNISSLLLIFKMYLFKKGVLINSKYSF